MDVDQFVLVHLLLELFPLRLLVLFLHRGLSGVVGLVSFALALAARSVFGLAPASVLLKGIKGLKYLLRDYRQKESFGDSQVFFAFASCWRVLIH